MELQSIVGRRDTPPVHWLGESSRHAGSRGGDRSNKEDRHTGVDSPKDRR
jgi:hypothetical protein